MNIKFGTFALLLVIVFGCFADVNGQTSVPRTARAASRKMLRTELHFGRSTRDGRTVTDAEWGRFLSDVVTPRFPDGFTAVSGKGQYRDSTGRIVSELSEVLIILYPLSGKRESRSRIEEIRLTYKKQFDQESVLRVDISSARLYF